MKWFLLLVIVAIVQYQGVTGFPSTILPDYAKSLPEKDHSTFEHVKPLKFEDFLKARLQLDASSKDALHLLPMLFPVDYLAYYLEHMKLVYSRDFENLKNLTAFLAEYKFVDLNDHVTKDKDTQDQSTFSNIALDNKMQVDATQTDSTLKKLPVNNPSLINKSGGKKRIFTPDESVRFSKSLHTQMELTRHFFNDLFKSFKFITNEIKSRILKNIKNQSKVENVASGDKLTLDESVINQQSSPDKNDDKKEESKDHEEPLIPKIIALSNKPEKKATEIDHEEPLIPESNEAEEKATEKLYTLDESYKKENPAKPLKVPLFFYPEPKLPQDDEIKALRNYKEYSK